MLRLYGSYNKEEEKEMLAILDTIAEENERILQKGIKKGKINKMWIVYLQKSKIYSIINFSRIKNIEGEWNLLV